MQIIKWIVLIALSFTSCAYHGIRYSQDFSRSTFKNESNNRLYRIYLIGDAGNAPENQSTPVFHYLKNLLDTEDINSSIVWLGDNIYPVGLAEQNSPEFGLGKHRLVKQLECHDNYKGNIYFIPGNHDWYEYGRAGIKRQESLIENYLSKRVGSYTQDKSSYFLPDSACGKIHHLRPGKDISLILMDSNWFLHKDQDVRDSCKQSGRGAFLNQLRKIIRENIQDHILICLHHPPYTYGSHGSRFSAKDYIFPLSQISSGLLIPIPFSGIIANQARGYITEQDRKHPAYKMLVQLLDEELSNADNAMVASGHEHSLQYIDRNNIHYIVSGAGSKQSAVALGKHSRFAAAKKGFVIIDFFQERREIKYIIPDEKGKSADLVFVKKIEY